MRLAALLVALAPPCCGELPARHPPPPRARKTTRVPPGDGSCHEWSVLGETVLLTGGTGTFGRAFLERVLPLGAVVRVFSRDELKQAVLAEDFAVHGANLRLFLGDVRDLGRLKRAAEGCDAIVHAAALKRVDSCEYNPSECVRTNVLGSMNVVEAALDCGVPRSVLLSSDKAVHPVNVYGASKLCAEKVWLAANAYAGGRDVRFSCVRYGNVVGSRGSVAERWANGGPVTLTDPDATRFWLEPGDAVELVLTALSDMRGGEVYVPKAPSSRVADLLPAGAVPVISGLGRGEKLHESLISDEEVGRTWDCGGHYVVADRVEGAERVPAGFSLVSSGVSGG